MNENRKNSSSKGSTGVLRTCTACCPFDAKNIPHPYFNYSSMNRTDIQGNDACCLSKLQVDCRIQCPKKKKKKNKQYYSSQSIQRSISSSSSSSQLSPNPKRKKISSTNSTKGNYVFNDDFDTQTSSSSFSNTNTSEQSLSSNQSKKNSKYHQKSSNAQQYRQSRVHINESIQNLKTSIDNLTQFIVHHQNSFQPTFSFLDRFRRFFTLFKSNE